MHTQGEAAWSHSGKGARRPSPEPSHAGTLVLASGPQDCGNKRLLFKPPACGILSRQPKPTGTL